MPAAFTHYWSESTINLNFDGVPFDHTAGNRFVRAGVSTGDRVYGITVREGIPILIGRMTVSRSPLSYAEACAMLPYDPWDADEHLIAEPGTASLTSFSRAIPVEMLRRLRFESVGGEKALKFVSEDRLDQQTLRGVRRLTSASALELESLLEPSPEDSPPLANSKQPTRIEVLQSRLRRDTMVVRQVKALYSDACQLCGIVIDLPGGGRYSEAHHIRPLGSGHCGSDSVDNLLCVCPNCHTMLDYGCIALIAGAFRMDSVHAISQENIDYHNQRIYGMPLKL